MKFKINFSLNIDRNHSLNMGNRTAFIRHERREHGYTNNPSIDPNLSKYNSYHDFYNFKNAMKMTIKPYADAHNKLKSVKKNPNRKIKDDDGYHKFLMKRGKRIPYRFIVGKMGTGKDTKALRQLFHKHHYTDEDFYRAFNQTAYDYGKEFNKLFSGNNKNNAGLSFDHLDTNVDETRRHGANHFHAGMLSHATTKKGKTSLSFDRAVRQIYGGTSNISAWSIMRNKEDHRFLKIATKDFRKYLGKDFKFKLQRNPHSSSGMAHNDFIKTKTAQDRYTQKSKELERKSNQSLMRRNRSLTNQNKKLRNRLRFLMNQSSTHKYNKLVDDSNTLFRKYLGLKKKNRTIQKHNRSLRIRLHKAKMCNSSLQNRIKNLNLSQNSLCQLKKKLTTNQSKLDKITKVGYSNVSSKMFKELPYGLQQSLKEFLDTLLNKEKKN